MSQTDPRGRHTTASPSTPGPTGDAPADDRLAADAIFHLLQTNRRRDALRYLKEHPGKVRMRDLAEQVAAWENDTTVAALSSAQRQRVYIPLYQTHLPKLDEAGVIEYDQSRGIVERTPRADQLDPYIREVEDRDGLTVPDDQTAIGAADGRDWIGYYAGASGFGIVLIGGTVLGFPPFARLSGLLVAAVVSAMFGLLTLAHHLESSLAVPIE